MDGVAKGLMDSVRAAPEDDAPRWVAADWFESAGQTDRARLVRIQLEAARLPAWDRGRADRAIEERVLLARGGERWRAELPALAGVTWGRFERGFVGRAAFSSAAALVEHGPACAEAAPLSGVVLRWPRLADRVALPRLDGVTEVTVTGTLMDAEDVAWLVGTPLMASVRRLNLVGSQLALPALQHLIASPVLAQLEALRLPLHNTGQDGLLALIGADPQGLVELDVSVATLDDLGSGGRWEPTIDEGAARALARWPGLARIRTLDLTGNQIGAEGLEALVTSKYVGALKALRLRSIADYDFEDDDGRPDVLVAFAAAGPVLRLEELDVSDCDLTDDSAQALRDSPALAELAALRFHQPQQIGRLVDAPWWPSLRVLEAEQVADPGYKAVFGSDLPQLHTLSLPATFAWSQPKSFAAVIRSARPLPSLVHLDLRGVRLSDEDLAALGAAECLPALRAFDLAADWADERYSAGAEATEAFASSAVGARLDSLSTGHEAHNRAPAPDPIEVYEAYDYRGPLRYL